MDNVIIIDDKQIEGRNIAIMISPYPDYHQAIMSPAFYGDYLKMWEELKTLRRRIDEMQKR